MKPIRMPRKTPSVNWHVTLEMTHNAWRSKTTLFRQTDFRIQKLPCLLSLSHTHTHTYTLIHTHSSIHTHTLNLAPLVLCYTQGQLNYFTPSSQAESHVQLRPHCISLPHTVPLRHNNVLVFSIPNQL